MVSDGLNRGGITRLIPLFAVSKRVRSPPRDESIGLSVNEFAITAASQPVVRNLKALFGISSVAVLDSKR